MAFKEDKAALGRLFERNNAIARIKDFIKKYWYFAVLVLIFATGAAFRIETYFLSRQLGFDEAQLVLNIVDHSGILWLFKPLDNIQVAPPFFLAAVKLTTLLFGISEMSLRFVPFLVSLASIPVFYLLSRRFLTIKRSVLFANLLFCINFILVLYGTECKQYGLDMLVFMLVLLKVSTIEPKSLESMGVKEILGYGLVFSLLFFVSQPVVFVIFGFILYNVILNFKNFKIYPIAIIPLVCVLVYRFSLPTSENSFMCEYWQNGFISFYNFPLLLYENIDFFTIGSKYLIPLTPLLFIGFFIIGFRKNRINQIFLLSLLGAFIASALHMFPLLGRTALYLAPFLIIFISACFDISIPDKKYDRWFTGAIIALILFVLPAFNGKILCKNRISFISSLSRAGDITRILKQEINKENDVVIIPLVSQNIYKFYSKYSGLNIDKDRIIKLKSLQGENFYYELDNIKNSDEGRNYWFYVGIDSLKNPVNQDFKAWAKAKAKILSEIKLGEKSYLYKIKF